MSVTWSVAVLSGNGLRVIPGSGTLSLDPADEQEVTVQVQVSAAARSGQIVLRAEVAVPGGPPVWLPPVHVRVDVS
jgi:hypothetical protein